jgi:hypothetical protein
MARLFLFNCAVSLAWGQKAYGSSNVLYEIYEQLQSENRCTIIKEKHFRNNAIKRQMQQNKRKIL